MRLRQLALCLMGALLFASVAAKADGIPDPVVDVSDPFCFQANPANCPNPIYTPVFTISANQFGGGFQTYTNLTGIFVNDLTFIAPVTTSVREGNITCVTSAFQFCQVSTLLGGTFVSIHFFDTDCSTCGWKNHEEFTVNLNGTAPGAPEDPNGTGGWGSDFSFTVVAQNVPTSAPEPASMVLMATGAAAILRKRFR